MRLPQYAIALMSLLTGPMFFQTGRQAIKDRPDLKLAASPVVKAGPFIYLSGVLATDNEGRIAGGDVRSQTRRVLESTAQMLKTKGGRLENAVSVTVFLRNASDFQAMNEVYRTYWPTDPPARATIAANLPAPEALVEISVIAVQDGTQREVVHPAGWVKSPSPYSYGIRSGDTLYLSGLLSRNGRDNSTVAGDIKVQTRTEMDNAKEILKAGGMTLDDVVAARVFITETSLFQDMNAAYRAYFTAAPPARATARAALMSPDALVEIALVAVRGSSRQVINPPNPDGSAAQPNPNLSAAIRVGSRVFLSGMLGNDANNRGDATGQARVALGRIAQTLKAAGFDWENVVDGTVYLTDMKYSGAMDEAYREVFKTGYPARAVVQAGLMSPDGLVEIMFTAQK